MVSGTDGKPMGIGSRSETEVAARRPGRSDRQACRAVAGPATRFRGRAPFVAFADLGAAVGGHRPERSRHRRDGPRPGPADSRWRGWTGFRRQGAARCRLGAAGPRALNSWSRQVRHAQPGWPPQLPEPSAPVRPRRLIAARESARPAAPDPAPPPHRPAGNRRPQGSPQRSAPAGDRPGRLMAASAQPWTEAAFHLDLPRIH